VQGPDWISHGIGAVGAKVTPAGRGVGAGVGSTVVVLQSLQPFLITLKSDDHVITPFGTLIIVSLESVPLYLVSLLRWFRIFRTSK
jgi:hypothetical protein